MRKRVWILPALALLLLAGVFVISRVTSDRYLYSEGRYLRSDCGLHMIVVDGSPIVMTDRNEKELFEGLSTGDLIRIRHGLIMETFPGRADVYACKRLQKGTIEDISPELLETLASMGYTVPDLRDPDPYYGDLQFPEKPVIYLYPREETAVDVRLAFDGRLTSSYPAYEKGWHVLARPDGTLLDPETGREYYCLFWEGVTDREYDFTEGFVVSGADTAAFLEESLRKLGLTDREANEFIIYWTPRMEINPWNLISFQQEAYTDSAKLYISPRPDTLIRVFMAWKALEEPIVIQPQTLTAQEREGFTVVEWGAAEVKP